MKIKICKICKHKINFLYHAFILKDGPWVNNFRPCIKNFIDHDGLLKSCLMVYAATMYEYDRKFLETISEEVDYKDRYRNALYIRYFK